MQIKYIPRRETRSSKIMRNKGMKALATTVPRISMETISVSPKSTSVQAYHVLRLNTRTTSVILSVHDGVGVSFVVLVQHGAEFGVVDATSLVFVKFGKSCLHLLFKRIHQIISPICFTIFSIFFFSV